MITSTRYQKSIKNATEFSVLKKGSSNKKLGFKVTAKKWRGKRLYSLTLVIEIASLLEKHKEGIVIRLHVLGDFFSVDYVKFWEDMLFYNPKLCLFGYTGRQLDTRIGNAIRILNLRFGERCVIRHSWNKESNGLAELYAAEESFEGKSFICPEQTGKVKDCASCGLCWTTNKTVKFLSH